jgi:hypothetical protein
MWNNEALIGDQRHSNPSTFRSPEQDFLDDLRTSIGIDPDAGT